MKTLHVGGIGLINRFRTLADAVSASHDGDVIEIHKDLYNVSVIVDKHITIKGNDYVITPSFCETALDCTAPVTLEHMLFGCQGTAGAIAIRAGGKLSDIVTSIKGPVKALNPTVIQYASKLEIENSDIMGFESAVRGEESPVTYVRGSVIQDFYNGAASPYDSDYGKSIFRGRAFITDSELTACLLAGECTLKNVVFYNYNKITGSAIMDSCVLKARKTGLEDTIGVLEGPFRFTQTHAMPYTICVAGGETVVKSLKWELGTETTGFYMRGGTLSFGDQKLPPCLADDPEVIACLRSLPNNDPLPASGESERPDE